MSETLIRQVEAFFGRPSSRSSQVTAGLSALAAVYILKKVLSKAPLALVPGPPSSSVLTGNFSDLLAHDAVTWLHNLSVEYGGALKFAGLPGMGDMLYFSDPLALAHIMKNLETYPETPFSVSMSRLVFGPGLLASHGATHRRQRKMLAPIFAIPYLRQLTPTFYHVAYQLRNAMLQEVEQKQAMENIATPSLDMISWLARVALELIGQAGLGHSFGALEGKTDKYSKAAKDFVPALTDLILVGQLLPLLSKIGSPSFRRKVVQALPSAAVQNMVRIVDDMDDTTTEVFERKKRLLRDGLQDQEVIADGKDLLTNLLKANEAASQEDRLPEDELKAQLNTLLFAANDTTSGALGRMLHLLAHNQDAQSRLRAEIISARKSHNGDDLDFHDIDNNMPYLDAVIKETLRVYPPVPSMMRYATKDDVVPLHYPVLASDKKEQLTSVIIPKGTALFIGITAANRSTAVWGPDAGEWKPERWLSPLPDSVEEAKVPSVFAHLVTFLNAGKSCIGYKFSLLEMKIVLFILLETFKFSPERDIEWHTGLTMTPHVIGDNAEVRLPLKVELCES